MQEIQSLQQQVQQKQQNQFNQFFFLEYVKVKSVELKVESAATFSDPKTVKTWTRQFRSRLVKSLDALRRSKGISLVPNDDGDNENEQTN